MLHEYTRKDVEECFGNRRIVFIGDSTTRQVFWAVARKLNQTRAKKESNETFERDQKHEHIHFEAVAVTLEFFWDPYLNSTALRDELESFNVSPVAVQNESSRDSAALILLGAPGLWYARSGQENYMKGFTDAVNAIIPFMDNAPQSCSAIPSYSWRNSGRPSPNMLLLAPIQVPRYESLSFEREETIRPEKIDLMNDFLQQASAYSKADILWSYSLMTWSGSGEYQKDGLHVIESVADRKADVLLNLRCNYEAASHGYPFDRTCCSNYDEVSTIRWIILSLGVVVFPALAFLHKADFLRLEHFLPPAKVLRAFVVFTLVLCLCFFADRTQLFEKSQKQFRTVDLTFACSFVMILGLGSVRRSRGQIPKGKPLPENGYLPRDQTDEWKGWMQAFILIYHFVHGSQTLWIYEIVRPLVASYLFMTGFGHSLYFLEKSDYSTRRVSTVLVRLNLLSCVLPYMMGTKYLFYYFAPLVSFWFSVVYATFGISSSRNDELSFLFGKMMFFFTLTTAATMIPGVWKFVSLLLEWTCAIQWDMQEWRFRTFLDMYIVYVGMVVAILFHRTSRIRRGLIIPTSGLDWVLNLVLLHPAIFQICASFASFVLLAAFWVFREKFSNKEDYNLWQPYVSFVPILSFVALRNCHQMLRNHYSASFAWLGRCSLETFILQYHIWLAADTKGLLRIGLWDSWIETAILTIVFLWISHHVADVTETLTAWIVGTASTSYRKRNLSSIADELVGEKSLLPSVEYRSPSRRVYLDGSVDETLRVVGRCKSRNLKWRLALLLFGLWFCNVSPRLWS